MIDKIMKMKKIDTIKNKKTINIFLLVTRNCHYILRHIIYFYKYIFFSLIHRLFQESGRKFKIIIPFSIIVYTFSSS